MTRLHSLLPLLLGVFLLPLTGCNTAPSKETATTQQLAPPADPTPVLTRIERSGRLVVATSADMPPMTQMGADGKPEGFDMDLAHLMAKSLGANLLVKTMPFAELLPALERGDVDVVLSNLTITPQRNKRVAFVGPYLTSGKCIITKSAELAKGKDSQTLKTANMRIAALKGSTSERFVRKLISDAIVVPVDNTDSGIQMVKNGEAGGMMAEYPICLSAIENNPDADFVTGFLRLSYEPIGFALPNNDPLFVNWTENFLQRLNDTDTLLLLGVRWLGPLFEQQQKKSK